MLRRSDLDIRSLLSNTINTLFSLAAVTNNSFVRAQQLHNFVAHHEALLDYLFLIQSINFISSFAEFNHNYAKNKEFKKFIARLNNVENPELGKIYSAILASLVGSLCSGIGHSMIFYEGHRNFYGNGTEESPGVLSTTASIEFAFLAGAGGLQELLLGGLELTEGVISKRPFFYTNQTPHSSPLVKRIKNLCINSLLVSAALAEFSLFYGEIFQLFNESGSYWVETLAVISATMNLSDESRMLLEWIEYGPEAIKYRKKDVIQLINNSLNAIIHGLSRYQILNHLLSKVSHTAPSVLIIPCAALSLGRFATLSFDFPHVEPHFQAETSHHYTAAKHGKDIIYQTIFAVLLSMPVKNDIYYVLACNMMASFVTEAFLLFINYIANPRVRLSANYGLEFLVNAMLAPLLSAGILRITKQCYPDIHITHEATATTLTTLVIRHLTYKALVTTTLRTSEPEEKHLHTAVTTTYGSIDMINSPRENISKTTVNDDAPRRISCCERIFSFFRGCSYGLFRQAEQTDSGADNRKGVELTAVRSSHSSTI